MDLLVAFTAALIGLIGVFELVYALKFFAGFPPTSWQRVAYGLFAVLALASIYLPDYLLLRFRPLIDPDVQDFYNHTFLPVFRGCAWVVAVATLVILIWRESRIKPTAPSQLVASVG